ncbi:hypothetical protein [Alkalimonas amylolytica]|uniref:Type IV pilus modification protein PilV n=1 Tax=Alkalimonas amylolytica TaxID=152573 RepID=A0A1H4FKZ9_ALKAM|nr:hypothetical protein [Alkalimonas amylolytica]SEA98029.1 type IV pilus modification protein PilV [Alkalimonas amylolytica]
MRLQQGISLLEVLLAVLLLKVSVLGALAGQLHARQIVTEATQRTQATAMAADWLNRMQASGHSFSQIAPSPECNASTPCPPESLASWLHQQWQQQWWHSSALAQGGYCSQQLAAGIEFVVYWYGRQLLTQTNNDTACDSVSGAMSLRLQAAL